MVSHYVEKPDTYVSTLINCGVYVCSLDIFQTIGNIFQAKQQEFYRYGCVYIVCSNLFHVLICFRQSPGSNKDACYIEWEREILQQLAGTGQLFALSVCYGKQDLMNIFQYLRKFCDCRYQIGGHS